VLTLSKIGPNGAPLVVTPLASVARNPAISRPAVAAVALLSRPSRELVRLPIGITMYVAHQIRHAVSRRGTHAECSPFRPGRLGLPIVERDTDIAALSTVAALMPAIHSLVLLRSSGSSATVPTLLKANGATTSGLLGQPLVDLDSVPAML
jgi:hypothetical protein